MLGPTKQVPCVECNGKWVWALIYTLGCHWSAIGTQYKGYPDPGYFFNSAKYPIYTLG